MTLGFALAFLSRINLKNKNYKDCLKFLAVWKARGLNKLQGEYQFIADNLSSILKINKSLYLCCFITPKNLTNSTTLGRKKIIH